MKTEVSIPQKGGILSHFQMSATATLFPAIAAIITALAKFSEYYSKMIQLGNKAIVSSANMAANNAQESLEHQATSMKWEATMGFVSAGLSAGSIAVNAGVDGYYAHQASGIQKQVDNGQTYLDAYEGKAPEVKLGDSIEMEDLSNRMTEEEAQGVYQAHQNNADKLLESRLDPKSEEAKAIELSRETPEAQEARKAIKEAMNRKQDAIRELMQDKMRRLDYTRLVDQMIQQGPTAISKEISQTQTQAQGKCESEKILASSAQSMDERFTQDNESQMSSNAQQMDQTIQMLDKMTQADRYR